MTTLSRRRMLLGVSALGLGASAAWRSPVAQAGGWMPGDPAEQWRHRMRMQMSTRAEDIPWWYTGRIYAQVGNAAPLHLFNLEGTEIYWPRPLADGSYAVSSRTLSFFRDKQTGEMLREFVNPYTNETISVSPNRMGGKDRANYSAAGLRFDFEGVPDRPPMPWVAEWQRSGDQVWYTSSRGLEFMPQPWLESMSVFCPLASFTDPAVANLPTLFSSTYLSPWMEWMNMGDRPGHLVWHSSGRKLQSIDEIPDEYRSRADREYGGLLTAAPDSWD